MTEIKLSKKQYEIAEYIRKNGHWPVINAQNPTVKKLISTGFFDFNSRFDALVFTKKGEKIQL